MLHASMQTASSLQSRTRNMRSASCSSILPGRVAQHTCRPASPSTRSPSRCPQQQQEQFSQESQRKTTCNGLFGLGLPELAVIAGVAALIFGPSKLPELGKGLGQTVKSFQTGLKEFESELKSASATDEDKADPKAGAVVVKIEEEKAQNSGSSEPKL
ncbi:MAG: hypothetical protein WDW38_011067 [Sanguina aurantia]